MKTEKTILVVEDVQMNRKILLKILRKFEYNALEAENGKKALEILEKNKDEISLVLLDISMPVMNGYELLNKMKESDMLKTIPVIMTTGSDNENEEVHSLASGATDFITKPYKADVVIHRVESILRLYENATLINSLKIDRLTGVYNREFFYRKVERILKKNPNKEYDILCCNIEGFKMINSKYGIEVGDELLRCVALNCSECVKDSGVCGRLGSDTFAVLREKRGMRSQTEVGERISTVFKDAPVKNFVIKYGLYQIQDKSKSVSEMCDMAQIAIASIKHKYGMHYAVYDESMHKRIERENQLINNMEQSLAEGKFVVYLQPKHNISTESIAGAEALVRWIHPELGFISPGEFIPLFERIGFISKIDHFVWEEICRVQHRWMQEGRKLIPISVNASRADFCDDNLTEYICELADSYQIPHEMLHFEVTESAYTDNPRQIISTVSTLRDMGFLIEMDDFGSGYSSLNMLSELPIDILKLDMKFMQKGNNDSVVNKKSILSFVVGLSKWLQYPTVAEGVETKEEVELLRIMGCNYIQGYYYAKPMPISSFEEYMDKNVSDKVMTKPNIILDDNKYENKDEKITILIAEDIDSNRELLVAMLSPYYNLIVTENGAEALAEIEKEDKEISCLILDLLMPVMDGFDLMEKLKSGGFLNKIPVIITSESGVNSELRALHLGAQFFVAKPYNKELLLHYTKKAVNEYKYHSSKNH